MPKILARLILKTAVADQVAASMPNALPSVLMEGQEATIKQLHDQSDRRRKIAAEEAERERVRKLPSTKLRSGYWDYAYVRYCYEIRQDYVLSYIGDVKMQQAKKAIKGIEAKSLIDDRTIGWPKPSMGSSRRQRVHMKSVSKVAKVFSSVW